MSELTKMSLTEQGIQFQPINVDIDKLFSLSYTFDNLKLFMNTLLENQNIMSSKINELEKMLKEEKDQSKNNLNILEKKLKTMVLTMKKEPVKIIKSEKIISEKIKEIKEIEKIDTKKEKIEENKEKDKNEEANMIKQKLEKSKEDSGMEPGSGSKVEDDEDDNDNLMIDVEEFENMKQKMNDLEQRLVTVEKKNKI